MEITDLNRHVVEEAQREAEARLEAEGPRESEAMGPGGMGGGPQEGFEAKLKTLKVAALKELCKEKGLKVRKRAWAGRGGERAGGEVHGGRANVCP